MGGFMDMDKSSIPRPIRNIIKTFFFNNNNNNNKVLIFKRNKVQRTLWSNANKSPCNCYYFALYSTNHNLSYITFFL